MDNILIVEDAPYTVKLVETVVRSVFPSSTVEAATDGNEACKKLETFTPDLLITDIMLPKMDGVEVIRHIRRREGLQNIHILVLTALQESDGRIAEVRRLGVDTVLHKPIAPAQLTHALRTIVCPTYAGEPPPSPLPPQEDPPGDTPVLNPRQLIVICGGKMSAIVAILKDAFDEFPRVLCSLDEALSDADYNRVRLAAHELKGLAANLGGDCLRKVAGEVELAAKNKTLTPDALELARIKPEVERLLQALKSTSWRDLI